MDDELRAWLFVFGLIALWVGRAEVWHFVNAPARHAKRQRQEREWRAERDR